MTVFGGDLAVAAPARIRFDVEPKRYSEALLELAQQANVTLIGAAACEGRSNVGLAGSFTLEEALDRLLGEAPCGWKVVAPGAVQVTALRTEAARPPPAPTTVSEVLVTATKRVRNPRQLAVAITTVSAEQLRVSGSTDVGEAAGQLAGVLATNLGPGRNKLLLRGLSDGAFTGRARSTVATYLDDIPLNYNAPDPDLRLVDVERVEVARGPQGALYGAGSMSGVYRIVSRQPDPGFSGGEVRATAAVTEGGAPSRTLEGYYNRPITSAATVRISAYDEAQGGYFDDIKLGRRNVDRTVRRGGRLIAVVTPDNDWTVTLTAAAQHLRSADTHYTRPGLGLTRQSRIAEPHVNDIALFTAVAKHGWGWGEFTSATGFIRHAYGSFYDATDTQTSYTDRSVTAAYSERTRTRMLVEDAYLASRGAGRFEWLVGAYGSITAEHSPTEFLAQNPGQPDVAVYGDNRHDRVREVAIYGEASYEFAPGWTAAIGGRLFDIENRTRSDVVSERFDPRSLDRRSSLSGFSPKVSLQWAFDGGDLVYAVMSEGFRAGGVNSGGALPLPPQRETYAPDRLLNFEAGVKLQGLRRRVTLNAAVFYDVWRDIQTDQFRLSGIPYTTNAGDARVLGLESELALRVAEGLIVQLNGRVSRTRTSNANPDFALTLADGLPGASAVSGGGLISYQRPVFGDWTLKVLGEANYVGRSRITFLKVSGRRMGGYVRSRLAAEIVGRRWGAQVFVTNVLNAYSDTFAFGNPFAPDQSQQVTPQRPRTIGLTLFTTY